MNIFKDGYKNADLHFAITEEKNFFIDSVHLLKNPDYRPTKSLNDGRIALIGKDTWVGYTQSGMMLYQDDFLS